MKLQKQPVSKPFANKNNEENETLVLQRTVLGVQHRGKITAKEATRVLRSFWPKTVVKEVEVKRRKEMTAPGYAALWIIVKFAPGYDFENYLDWPEFEENWPETFDKGLFKEDDDDVPF